MGPHGLKDFFVRVDHASGRLAFPHLIDAAGLMKPGVIINLLGSGEAPDGVKPGTCYQELSHLTGPREVVVSQPGLLELDDA